MRKRRWIRCCLRLTKRWWWVSPTLQAWPLRDERGGFSFAAPTAHVDLTVAYRKVTPTGRFTFDTALLKYFHFFSNISVFLAVGVASDLRRHIVGQVCTVG